ncbi:unnamed protein product [Phaedon cochleariae]|uniref:Peptidase S1 domain-containing protein n=1 Tax=Phaedon cochleariae TaxID=80249 RepID=A0A9N9SEA2_PHACE|nr:unnamed protein product [Phaedon cochleariae]
MKSGILLLLVLASTQSLPQSQRYEDYFVHPYRREPQPLRPGLRIIGGQDAPPHVLPYQVGIYVYSASSTDFCGGSLISTNYVLTAAHCADQAMKMDLVFGAQNISDESEDTQIRISSTEFIVHEKWSRASLANDIALVKLRIVSGWGKSQDDQTTVTEILKYLTSPILSNSQCSEASASYARIMNPTLLCLSGVELQEQVSQEDVDPSDSLLYLKTSLFKIEPRIIGGADVEPHSYPFQAILFATYEKETSFCGGTLIDRRWILTAAHCVDSNPKYIDIFLGAHNLTNLGAKDTIQTFRSKSYRKHADYDNESLVNDIAIIRLPKDAILNEYVNVVPISNGTNTYAGEYGTILGWGKTDDGSVSDTLKGVTVEVISNEACRSINPAYEIVVESHVCVSGEGPRGSCGGDSGGPLLVKGTQIGLVSFGADNCTLGMPSVFTRLSRYNDWIVENMNSNSGLAKVRNVLLGFVIAVFAFLYAAVNIFV